jgi:hypothetical protein
MSPEGRGMSVDEAAGRLSESGIEALRRLWKSRFGPSDLRAEAENLIRLGLAELVAGDIALTGFGRSVAQRFA